MRSIKIKIIIWKCMLISLCLVIGLNIIYGDIKKKADQIQRIVKLIQSENILMNDAVGYSGEKPEQYKNFERLLSIASTKDLHTLTGHRNGVVRCYAVWGLIIKSKKNLNFYKVANTFLHDDEEVKTMFGCSISQSKVGDFIIGVIIPYLSAPEKEKLTIRLLAEKNNLDITNQILYEIKPEKKYYEYIHKLAKQKNKYALLALSRYQKKQNLPLIEQLKSLERGYYFKAISHNLHPRYKSFLRQYGKDIIKEKYYSNEWKSYFKVIAAYHDDFAIEICTMFFNKLARTHNLRMYYFEFMFAALSKYKDGFYDAILLNLWDKENITDMDTVKYLYSNRPGHVAKIVKEKIKSLDDYYSKPDTVIPLSDIGIASDKDYTIKQIAKNIISVNIHVFDELAKLCRNIKDARISDAFLTRIQQDKNPYAYLAAVKTLLSYNDRKINRKIVKLYNSHPHLQEGWGGEALKKLLEKMRLVK